jgi:lycopene beta-cyclase
MTYFGFLGLFVVIPIILFLVLNWLAQRSGRVVPDSLRGMPFVPTLLAHVLIALVYTTPWDNYLVATRVWWYDPELVSGLVIGWVPIEEYTFFILQPIMTGLLLLLLTRFLPVPAKPFQPRPRLRLWSTVLVGLIWLVSVVLLLAGYAPATYLSLALGWALPPIMLQLAFGADILWRYKSLVFWTLVPATLYLAWADSLAISAGTWTIDPAQSFNIFLGGVLPIEEFIFFLLTNTLLVFGVTLVLARESQGRLYNDLIPWANSLLRRPNSLDNDAA